MTQDIWALKYSKALVTKLLFFSRWSNGADKMLVLACSTEHKKVYLKDLHAALFHTMTAVYGCPLPIKPTEFKFVDKDQVNKIVIVIIVVWPHHSININAIDFIIKCKINKMYVMKCKVSLNTSVKDENVAMALCLAIF